MNPPITYHKTLAEFEQARREEEKGTMNEYNEPWGIELTPDTIWVGPLRTDGIGKVNEVVFHMDIEGLKVKARSRRFDNAKRIVACVNACCGVSNEQLGSLQSLIDKQRPDASVPKPEEHTAIPVALEALRDKIGVRRGWYMDYVADPHNINLPVRIALSEIVEAINDLLKSRQRVLAANKVKP